MNRKDGNFATTPCWCSNFERKKITDKSILILRKEQILLNTIKLRRRSCAELDARAPCWWPRWPAWWRGERPHYPVSTVVAAPTAEATGGAPESDSALQINFDLCIPKKRNCAASVPMSIFMCVCERFIYSQDRSTYFPAAEYVGRPTVRIYIRTQKHECRNWDCGRANPFLGIEFSV